LLRRKHDSQPPSDNRFAIYDFFRLPHIAMSRLRRAAEVALIFGVFCIQGSYPVPDVNEPNYLGKAVHFWNPAWAQSDFFLNTKDAHQVFYIAFGWLSLWLPPPALAWTGRLLTWALLAWAWRRLSFAAIPRPWLSVLTAALLVCLIDRCNMAGEWIVGGVEAKGFAFVLVFLGLEAMLKERWNRVWLLLGAASAFHVLVGGWTAIAAGLTWLLTRKQSNAISILPSPILPLAASGSEAGGEGELVGMLPALLGGLLLSLPGLVPSLMLTWGADPENVRLANLLYVFHRLYHHLSPMQIPPLLVTRFVLLCLLWMLISELAPRERPLRYLRIFVLCSLAFASCGWAIGLLENYDLLDRATAARLLRFYWFRLSDVAVPMGAALMGVAAAAGAMRYMPAAGKRWMTIMCLLGCLHLGAAAVERFGCEPPRADRMPRYAAWREICDFVAHAPESVIPKDALFLTPRLSATFKWYAGRGEAATWKEFPQDADGIADWWLRLRRFNGSPDPELPWHDSLAEVPLEQLRRWGNFYGVNFILTENDPPLPLSVVWENDAYAIYRLEK
jgi:hypothetical protein